MLAAAGRAEARAASAIVRAASVRMGGFRRALQCIARGVDCQRLCKRRGARYERVSMMETDYLVLGSGVAGLSFALRAAAHGRVMIVSKRAPEESNTRYAQGGVSAVFSPEDSVEAHVADTLTVGEGLCREAIVRIACGEGPALVRELAERFGARFDKRADGEFELGREGGHSQRRVVHAKDTTGREIERALL